MTDTEKTIDRAPVKPQDHKRTKSDILADSTQPPTGADLLRPVEELRSGEIADAQADILQLFADIGIDLNSAQEGEEVSIETTPDTLRGIGKLGALLETFAVDKDAYAEFDRGRGAQGRVMELAMWYMGQLGESDGSAS